MLGKTLDELVPILIDYDIGTLGGRDIAVVLRFARSPEELIAGIKGEIALAMTLQQAQELGVGLFASVNGAAFGPAANDTDPPLGFSQWHEGSPDKTP